MHNFMDLVQNAFYSTTKWNIDNSYSSLNASTRALLDFPTPRGLRMNLSSLATRHFATSYTLGSLSVIDGSLSYLYTTVPLRLASTSAIDLRLMSPGYRQLQPTPARARARKGSLLCGRLYLPSGILEALYVKRVGARTQLRVTAVSDSQRKHGGTIMGILQHDTGRWCSEYLYSTDVALLGWRGLYNFGRDNVKGGAGADRPVWRCSAGAELYYGVLNKSAGMSTGLRYTTLPSHPGIPLTMTLTLNPLMGHLSATYALLAGKSASFASRFEFNMYSYESDIVLGCELWRGKGEEGAEGVLKAKVTRNGSIGLLWEGRFKELLFSVGGLVDFGGRGGVVKVLGVELSYSS